MYKALLLAFWFCFAGEIVRAQTFTVPGNAGHNWIDTQLAVPPHALVKISATGQVDVGAGWGMHGPEGTTNFVNGNCYPAMTDHRYGLVARVTTNRLSPNEGLMGQWAYRGEKTRFYVGSSGGHLWLTVNDDFPKDNVGKFLVNVAITRRARRAIARPVRFRRQHKVTLRPGSQHHKSLKLFSRETAPPG
jgi:hypothetical protein